MNRMLLCVAFGLLSAAVFGPHQTAAEAAPEPAKLQPAREADPAPPPTDRDNPVEVDRAGKVLAVTADSITIQGHDAIYTGGKLISTARNVRTFAGEGITFYKRDGRTITPTLTGVAATVSREEYSVTAADGKVTTVRRAGMPPYKYKMSAVLAAGGFPPDASDCRSYRLSDVRKGDEVVIITRWVNGVWECASIKIDRRPGGKVPPSNNPDKADPWHERANALQDWEYNGTPLPNKYR